MFAALSAWNAELAEAFRDLSKPQVQRLAEYSLGVILAGRCGLSCVAAALAMQLGESFNTVRERLRDFYCLAHDKSGRHRRELPVEQCYAPLLAWLLKRWPDRRLPIALDASNLSDRFVVLSISVLYRGTGLPVAWVILPANAPGSWRDHWQRLLALLKPAVPPELEVLVLADRGLYAPWLFEQIHQQGWHPLLRINAPETFHSQEGELCMLASCVPGPGHRFCRSGQLFGNPKSRLNCTLAGCWEEGYEEPWWLVSDLSPGQFDPLWYTLRGWIECGFKHTKTGGLNWQQTRMCDPERAMRVYLVMALASIYLACIGSQESLAKPPEPADPHASEASDAIQSAKSPCHKSPSRKPRRVLSVLRFGILLAQNLIRQSRRPSLPTLLPQLWPCTPKLQPAGP